MTAPASTSRRKRRSRHIDNLTPEKVTSAFLACPRCSFFLSGYKLIHSDLAEAAKTSEDGWLNLTWNDATRLLVQKNFGCFIDKNTISYEGTCRDCQRVLFCRAEADGEEAVRLLIEVVPG